MADATEQTAPVVDAVAKLVVEETAKPDAVNEVVDAAKPTDKEEPEAAPEATPATTDVADTAEPTPEVEEDIKSKKVTLADLSAKGTALYAQKKYEDATEVFSRASILQAEINGETAPENAEILFHYGRSLFKVGQSKSDVLGGPAAADKQKKAKADSKPKKPAAEVVAEKTAEEVVEKKDEEMKDDAPKTGTDAKKPLFQFTGDENFELSDEEEVR
jgi:HAT1-interacting factor 1